MTEDDRFTWKTVHGWHTNAFLVVMNGLDKKNKRLKQEKEQLMQDWIRVFLSAKNEQRKLKEENEQLKEKNKKINERNLCLNSELSYYQSQYRKITQSNQLKKENEKLKNEIKMLKSTIARNEAYITRLTKKGKWTK